MKEVRLKDLYLVAYVLNEDEPLIRADSDGFKKWFVFEDTQKGID